MERFKIGDEVEVTSQKFNGLVGKITYVAVDCVVIDVESVTYVVSTEYVRPTKEAKVYKILKDYERSRL